jgi:hypothetical protein
MAIPKKPFYLVIPFYGMIIDYMFWFCKGLHIYNNKPSIAWAGDELHGKGAILGSISGESLSL